MSETKFRAGHTFLIGLAFFSSEIAWSLYNAQVPVLINLYISSFGLVGLMMALDNILGIILQPILGAVSDNTRTRLGRRMPYLLIGIPLGAIFFSLIPTQTDFLSLTLWMVLFGASMGFYRSQAVSLMPDFVKPVHRSKGNAIINFMGGIGVAFGYGFSLLLSLVGLQLLFLMVSIIMVVALVILLWRIKETESFAYRNIIQLELEKGEKIKTEVEAPGILASFKTVIQQKDMSLLFMLAAIFFWFIGYQGIVALITLYGINVLGYPQGLAGFLPFLVTVPLLISIIPLGYLATKIGRRNAIKIGVIIWIAMLIIGFFFGLIQAPLLMMAIPLAFLGIGWALINTNSIVIVWELAPTEKDIGTYTGLYYFSSYFAAILGPMIVGFMTDLFTMPSLLLNGALFFIFALIMMFFVKRGEAKLTDEEKALRQKAIQELRTD